MSLINNMLKDLENRSRSSDTSGIAQAHLGLHPVVSTGKNHVDRFRQISYLLLAVSILVFTISLKAMVDSDTTTQTNNLQDTETTKAGQHLTNEAELKQVATNHVAQPVNTGRTSSEAEIQPLAPLPTIKPVNTIQTQAKVDAIKPQSEIQPSRRKINLDSNGSSKNDQATVNKKIRIMTPVEKAQALYESAVSQIANNNWSQAERKLFKALSLHPQHLRARDQYIVLLLKMGRRLEALQQLDAGIKNNPEHILFAQQLAHLYIEKGQTVKAVTILESSLQHAAEDAEYAALLAALYQRQSRHAEAITFYQRAVSTRPAEGKWWLGLAIAFESENQQSQAVNAYGRAKNSGLDMRLLEYANQRLAALQ